MVALGVALWPLPTFAHDPSAWGGLFRTRDGGATWSPANAGSFVSGAIALAVSRVDPHHLLLATDSGVSRSRNGGRDWEIEAPEVLVGPAFAVALDTDGRRALVSMGSAIFRNDGDGWRAIGAPGGAEPARAFVAGLVLGRVYLAGWSGLYRSDDWATSWTRASDGLPEAPVNVLAVVPAPAEGVFAICRSLVEPSMVYQLTIPEGAGTQLCAWATVAGTASASATASAAAANRRAERIIAEPPRGILRAERRLPLARPTSCRARDDTRKRCLPRRTTVT